jgi:DNA-binding NtrC family response regulator
MDEKPILNRRADHGARILVVDDDALARRSLRAMLERDYYKVETAEGGEKALELLSSYKPELVLLDIQMPDMDGSPALPIAGWQWCLRPVYLWFMTINGHLTILSIDQRCRLASFVRHPPPPSRRHDSYWTSATGSD